MALNKLLDLAREILTTIIDTKEEWLIVAEEDETLEDALQAEIDGYQGYGFLYNWILFVTDHDITDSVLPTVTQRFYQTVAALDDEDQEELETMIRDLAVDYLATGKVM